MKAISFEAIRNFLRTKKKSADNCGDASFKRSDSFKRISIRRSYLNRGRKRTHPTVYASKSGVHHANQPSGKFHHVNSDVVVQEPKPTSIHNEQATRLFSEQQQRINVHVNSDIGKPINTSTSRIAETVQKEHQQQQQHHQQHHKNTETEAIIKNGRNKSCKISIRSSGSSSAVAANNDDVGDDGAGTGLLLRAGTGAETTMFNETHRFQQRPAKNKCNKYDEVTTSTSCFVKAGSMLKKPIGTGLDVTAADPIDQHINFVCSRDPFYELLLNSENKLDRDRNHKQQQQQQRIADKIQPKSLASNTNDDALQQSNRLYVQQQLQHDSIMNKSNRFSDLANLNTSNNESTWSTHKPHQSVTSNPIDNKSTFKISNEQQHVRGSGLNHEEMPSFITFKTYSTEQNANGFLKTCFNNASANECKKKSRNQAMALQNNSTAAASSSSSSNKCDASNRNGKGVVIQISESGFNIDNTNRWQVKEALKKKLSRDSALGDTQPDYSDAETSLNGKFTFEIYKQMQSKKQFGNLIDSKLTINDQVPFNSSRNYAKQSVDESFAAMHICDKMDNNFFLEPDTHEYSNGDAGDDIPYPLRIKTNPFTNQKEPYSVNLGRVWKQLNLGQDDQSIETSIEKTNSKVKNDSFRSISSHDSGFSLTLTKQKTLFNRKHQKKSKRCAKIILTKNGQMKKVSNFQRTVTKQSKSNQHKQQPMDSKLERKTMSKPKSPLENLMVDSETNACAIFVNENYEEEEEEGELEEDDDQTKLLRHEDRPVDFSQEISDLETFFEEHLKRLKEYYVRKKRIYDQNIEEVCRNCDGKPTTEPKFALTTTSPTSVSNYDVKSPAKNYSSIYVNKHINNTNSSNQSINNRGPIKLSYDVWNGNLDFPYPDKRVGLNANHNKKHSTCSISNDLKYASLDFSHHLQNKKLGTPMCNGDIPERYANANKQDHQKMNANNDDDFQKQSTIINYNHADVGGNIDGDVNEFLHNDSDDKYEDIFNDNELIYKGVCVLCDKIDRDCECPMNNKLANLYSITPDNILCNCIGALNAPIMKTDFRKNTKSRGKSATRKTRLNTHKVKRGKRNKWQMKKNHSLRREYVASKCQFFWRKMLRTFWDIFYGYKLHMFKMGMGLIGVCKKVF